MINPYASVNWENCKRIMSCSHVHCETEVQFANVCALGYKHIALSNYYPSAPYYPLENFFANVPGDVIGSPNAEHHHIEFNGSIGNNIHLCSIGSTWASGSPTGEKPLGVSDNWKYAIREMLKNLKYPNGGGVTINHPTWSNMSLDNAKRMLDLDERVLGIEIFNSTSETSNGTGWALDFWDELLKTGRRAWGFCVADHDAKTPPSQGSNILLVNAFTEMDCLEAYRNGWFYGTINATDLRFEKITLNGSVLNVKTNNATRVNVIVDGVPTTYNNNEITHTIPSGAIYVRVEAHTNSDSIFSNPIIFKQHKNKVRTNVPLWY